MDATDSQPALDVLRRRHERFRLQGVARRLLAGMRHTARSIDTQTGQQVERLVPYRVTRCLWAMHPGERHVTIQKSASGAAYSGLQICGSVWHCPVCAARISSERRDEIQAALVAAESLHYKPILVTLTARHRAYNALSEQLHAITEAFRSLWRGRAARRFKDQFGILGFIRNLEVTHAKRNGWHPHIHLIVLVSSSTDLAAFSSTMRQLWEVAAAKHGLTMNEHGFHATDANHRVADYVAKFGHDPSIATQEKWQSGWNAADELSRWHTKRGKSERDPDDHLTPWQLLECAGAGDKDAGRLFQKYARVFHGRRQLHWSENLHALLGLQAEVSDQEAAEQATTDIQMEVRLTWQQWQIVRGNDARAELLALVERAADADEIRFTCKKWFGFEPSAINTWAIMQTSDPTASHKSGLGFLNIAITSTKHCNALITTWEKPRNRESVAQ